MLHDREANTGKSGRLPALSVGAQLLLMLEFWREDRTYFHLGQDVLGRTAPLLDLSGAHEDARSLATLARWGVHETTVLRTDRGPGGRRADTKRAVLSAGEEDPDEQWYGAHGSRVGRQRGAV